MKLLLSRSTQILPQGWDVDWLVGRSGFGAKTIWISKLPRSVTHCQAPHTTETTPNSWERNEINSCKWMWLTHNRLAIALDYYITYSQDCKAEACKANSSAHLLHGEDPQNHLVLSYPTDKEGEGETSGTCLRSELEPRCLHPKFRSLSPAPPCQWWNWGRRGGVMRMPKRGQEARMGQNGCCQRWRWRTWNVQQRPWGCSGGALSCRVAPHCFLLGLPSWKSWFSRFPLWSAWSTFATGCADCALDHPRVPSAWTALQSPPLA